MNLSASFLYSICPVCELPTAHFASVLRCPALFRKTQSAKCKSKRIFSHQSVSLRTFQGRSKMSKDNKACFLCLKQDCDLKCPQGEHYACSANHLEAHLTTKENHCLPWRIEESDEFGRFFVATRDIEPLELILVDKAAVIGPATKTKPICLECLQRPQDSLELAKCKGCQFPLCSRCVKLAGMTFHASKECDFLAKCSHRVKVSLNENFMRPLSSNSNLIQALDLNEDSLLYASIFLLRMILLQESNPDEHSRMSFLMDGNTSDLMDHASFSAEIAEIMGKEMGISKSREEIVRLMGIKRTNASTLLSVGLPNANAIYPVYNLMNSFCTCNTRCRFAMLSWNFKCFTMKRILGNNSTVLSFEKYLCIYF